MKLRVIVAAGVAAVVAVGGFSYVILRDQGSKDSTTPSVNRQSPGNGQASEDAAAIQFPAPWTRIPAEAADEKAGVLLRLQRAEPEAGFLLRRILGRIEPPLDPEKLADETEAALQKEVEGFVLLEKSVLKRGAQKIVSLDYIQGKDRSTFRALLLVVPTSDRTFYLTFRGPSGSHSQVRPEYDKITDGFFDWLHGNAPNQ